jgi:hypothetical protein
MKELLLTVELLMYRQLLPLPEDEKHEYVHMDFFPTVKSIYKRHASNLQTRVSFLCLLTDNSSSV